MATVVLNIPDISCQHCAQTVTSALTAVEGVAGVQVDVPGKKARVEYDASRIDVAQLRDVLAQEDYPVASVEA